MHNYYLIPYCIRLDDNEEQAKGPTEENIETKIHFVELKQQGIKGEDLLKWSLPIDIAEEYEMNNGDFLHNCSSPWFGSRCQYKFPLDLSIEFSQIVSIGEKFVTNDRIVLTAKTNVIVKNLN